MSARPATQPPRCPRLPRRAPPAHRPLHLGGVLRSPPDPSPPGPPHPACGASGPPPTDRRLGSGSRASGYTFSFLEARCGPVLSPQSEVSEGRQGRGRSTGDEESLAILRRWVACPSPQQV